MYASHPNILRPEQELSVQIGFFNEVHVRHSDVSVLTSTESNHCKVFKELAANSTSSNLGRKKVRNYITYLSLTHQNFKKKEGKGFGIDQQPFPAACAIIGTREDQSRTVAACRQRPLLDEHKTGPHQEILLPCQLLLECGAKHSSLPIIPGPTLSRRKPNVRRRRGMATPCFKCKAAASTRTVEPERSAI